ncbi:BCD family MFS transporter [Aestuariicella hydrocarbonica]|uniref:BCD family MFS transporter n=1 Tax=Pseudomaricurvus hydrocarbonicus TaxID=1470433 RepID=A0A9E5MN51_9GAMM|nr:BCD family MFS transporter [Aestuariicella hydrocarbonica]NHO67257.1 BCD family MFS transporter [Aestuariicella hydrocarbonica]
MDKLILFVRAFQLTLPRAAAGWLFALLTSNFNRIAIYELGITAVVITTLLGLYHFLSPFQVIYGRIADRVPIFGLHRTPYVLIGMLISAVAVAALPYIVVPMSQTPDEFYFLSFPYATYIIAFIVLVFFGIGFAMAGANHLALVAEVIPERSRGLVTALIWTMLILGMILSLQFIRGYMPEYNEDTMRSLYLLSIPIVGIVTLLGVIGVEPRVKPGENIAAGGKLEAEEHASLKEFAVDVVRNSTVRNFFLFIFLFMFGYSLQDNILEVFGAEVLSMTVGETGRFQQIWGGGAIVGMFMMGFLVFKGGISKIAAISFGISGIGLSMFCLAYGAYEASPSIVHMSLVAMGFFNGFALVGTLTSMMEFTTDNERGAYIGLWGLAIAFASGLASIAGGQLVTTLIESGWFAASEGFAWIFVLEGGISLLSLVFLWQVKVDSFHKAISKDGLSNAMAADLG